DLFVFVLGSRTLGRLDRTDGLRARAMLRRLTVGAGERNDARLGLLAGLAEFADVLLVDEADAHLIDHHQQRVELVGRNNLVGQALVKLFVGEIPTRSAKLQKNIDAFVGFFL